MKRKERPPLAARIAQAAEATLAAQDHVSLIDVMERIGWLYPGGARRWQTGQVECLEALVQSNPARIAEVIDLLGAWAIERRLTPSEASYVARSPDRRTLRFSASGDQELERRYRTHWLAASLTDKQQRRAMERSDQAPELVVTQPLHRDWACHRCNGTGDLLIMEPPGPTCLRCAGLDDLEFLPSGDATLSRRAKARSERHAVVVRFSRSRKRYERQGLLVEATVLAEVRRELGHTADE